jgi:hypothetical protein
VVQPVQPKSVKPYLKNNLEQNQGSVCGLMALCMCIKCSNLITRKTKKRKKENAGENRKNKDLSFTALKYVISPATVDIRERFLKKLKTELPHDPGIPHLGI